MSYQRFGYTPRGFKEPRSWRFRDLITETHRPGVLGGGTFSAFFAPNLQGLIKPVIVSTMDGVGTKLDIARMCDRHESVGADLVYHCANDLLCQGAEPLFFLDYIGFEAMGPDVLRAIIRGMAFACKEVGASLVGGEMAKMLGYYPGGRYDLVGCMVGIADYEDLITVHRMTGDEVLIGLPSLGLHTNGYTFARRVLLEKEGLTVEDEIPGLGITVGDELLKPHKCYLKAFRALKSQIRINGIAHITGSGIPENLARILPDNCGAKIETSSWPPLPICEYLENAGDVSSEEAFRIFNMGIGIIFAVPQEDADQAFGILESAKENPIIIGEITTGNHDIEFF